MNHLALSCLSAALATLAGQPEAGASHHDRRPPPAPSGGPAAVPAADPIAELAARGLADLDARLEDSLSLPNTPSGEGPGGLPAAAGYDRARLAEEIAQVVRERRLPGAAVAVVDGSGTFTLALGMAALETGRPMTSETLFRVGSLTKPFLSLAILRLVEAGKLRLTDRVRDLAPEIAVENRWEATDPIRVEHLLEHTSGFDEMRFNEIFEREGRPHPPLREVLAVNPRSRVARWRPGSRFAYSQPGYTLAGYIVEKVSGKPLERFLEEEVFRPLGVQGATLRFSPEVRDRLAVGYHERRPVGQVRLMHWPGSNLMISVAGLARLIEMQLGRGEITSGRFLQAASLARMERCGTVPHAPALACYGLGNWGDVGGPIPARGHGGFIPGYLGFYRYFPARGFGYVVLTNDTWGGGPQAIARLVMRHLLAGVTPPPAPSVPGPLPAPGRYTGQYRMAAPDVEFLRFRTDVYAGATVSSRQGQLVLETPELHHVPLIATGSDSFRIARECETSIRFSHSAEGRRVMRIRNTTFEEESALLAAARRIGLELALLLLFASPLAPLYFLLTRRREEAAMLLRPAVAAVCLLVMATAFDEAHDAGRLGEVCLLTLTVWVASWLFALAAHTGFRRAIRRVRLGQGSAGARFWALVLAGAAVWIALHLARYGLVGLRTWRW